MSTLTFSRKPVLICSGVYANPYSYSKNSILQCQVSSKEELLNEYRKYFYKRIENDGNFFRQILKLKGRAICCYCKEKCVHGEVIIEFLEKECHANKVFM